MPEIEKKFKDKISIEYRDITDIENYKLLLALQAEHNVKIEVVLPVFYLKGHFLNSRGRLKETLEQMINTSLGRVAKEKGELPHIDLIAHFKTFRPLTIISAGLIDGINPCAFTVIVFFISFLALQGYRKRELIIIGLFFIFAVFLTYFLIGLGLFDFIYRLKGFWLVTKILNFSIGIFSIILGLLCLYDFFKFKKTRDTEGLLLQLPAAVKNQIHSVIGLHYRAHKQPEGSVLKKHVLRLIWSALITGFLVSILEAVCTGQVYLPTITFVLKTTHLKLPALGYLLLYNSMFVVPLLLIFCFALLGVTSEQFAKILKKHLLTIKIMMALLFFGLGIFLIWGEVGARQSDYQISKNAQNQPADPHAWDFGQVKAGSILKHNFILKNETQKVLNITGINTSCGCTVSKIEKKTLSPGESTSIEVQFNTKGYLGPTQQYIYVNTDNLDNPILRYIIKADIVK